MKSAGSLGDICSSSRRDMISFVPSVVLLALAEDKAFLGWGRSGGTEAWCLVPWVIHVGG